MGATHSETKEKEKEKNVDQIYADAHLLLLAKGFRNAWLCEMDVFEQCVRPVLPSPNVRFLKHNKHSILVYRSDLLSKVEELQQNGCPGEVKMGQALGYLQPMAKSSIKADTKLVWGIGSNETGVNLWSEFFTLSPANFSLLAQRYDRLCSIFEKQPVHCHMMRETGGPVLPLCNCNDCLMPAVCSCSDCSPDSK